jgi:bifunctional DNA-binding transcriptional regulator/antitoxin component of YhaV-PrlF toxin-antitoxin module
LFIYPIISVLYGEILTTETIGKVGSKGELYPPKKIRDKIGLEPEMEIEYIISPNGELIIRKVEKLEDILKLKTIAKISQEEFEEMSEEMQNRED